MKNFPGGLYSWLSIKIKIRAFSPGTGEHEKAENVTWLLGKLLPDFASKKQE